MKKCKILFITLISILLLVFAVSCSGNGVKNYSSDESSGESTSNIVITEDRMIVYTVDMSLTVDKLSTSISTLETKALELGGYESSSRNSNDHSAYLVFKIPTTKLNDFINTVAGVGEVSNKTVSTEDITEQYVVAKAYKESLETKKAALENLLNNTTDYNQVLELTKEISDISSEIDLYTKKMSDYKSRADYSTIYINLYENYTYVEPTFWDELGDVLSGSAGSVGTFFGIILKIIVALLPYAGIGAAVFGLVILIMFIVSVCRKEPFMMFKKGKLRRLEQKQRRLEKQKKIQEQLDAYEKAE